MKLLLLLILSSRFKDILLFHIQAEEKAFRNFSSAETTTDVSPEKITVIKESSTDTIANTTSATDTSIDFISAHQRIINTSTTSTSEILAPNTTKQEITQAGKMVSFNHSVVTSETIPNEIMTEEILKSNKSILPACETSTNVTSANETLTTIKKTTPTQWVITEEALRSTTTILPALETPQNVTFVQETSTAIPEATSTQNKIAIETLGSTAMVSPTIASNINSTQSTSSIPIPTQHTIASLTLVLQNQTIDSTQTTSSISIPTQQTIASLTPVPQNQTKGTNQTLTTSRITPFANMTTQAKGSKKNKQKASKTTRLITTPKPKTTHPSRETSPLTPISRIPLTTREIDYKESIEFGEDNFKKFMFRTSVLFVDKSLMIKEFLEHDKQVILITRPIHWGKSLNLNMLRKFFEIEVDHQGNILPEENRVNQKIFCGGQVYINDSQVKSFQPLKISNFSSAMEHQGKHPVVQLNYHSIKNGTFDDVKAGMMNEVIKSYKRYSYLDNYFKTNPHFLDESEKSQLERYSKNNLTESDLVNSLRFLSQLLYKYFNQTVFILIDEYDTPLKDAFLLSSDNPGNLEKVLKFYRDLYTSVFKNNSCLAKGFLTGELRIANSNLFLDVDNMAEYTLLDDQFSQFYGFTEQELDQLMEPSLNMEQLLDRQFIQFHGSTGPALDKLVGPSLKKELYQMKQYYKGFNYGGQTMYNPWSIKQCIENGFRLEQYWLPCGVQFPGRRHSYSLDGIVEDVKRLLGGHSIVIPIENEVSYDNLADRRNFFNFILFTGYLSPTIKYPNGTYELEKPNSEVNMLFGSVIGDWMPKRPFG